MSTSTMPRRLLLRLRLGRPSVQPCLAGLRRHYSTKPNASKIDIAQLLETPTWSIRSLLPSSSPSSASTPSAEQTELTSAHLHHLLRLCALPPPATPAEEESLLKTLRDHLHFVRSIQSVDTAGVEPLARIEGYGVPEKVIEWEDVVGAEEKLEQQGVGAMGKLEWKPMRLAEGEGRKKGQVGGFYVVEETEEGGAR